MENKAPGKMFDSREVAGSATYKQSKTVRNCVVLQGQFVYSIMKTRRFVYFVCLGIKNSVKKDLYLLIKMSSPKLRSAPLKT